LDSVELRNKPIIMEAREKMFEQADLQGKPRTIANEILDVKMSAFPFVRKIKVTASAQVIEFTD